MQTIIQVISTRTTSLRDRIVNDPKLKKFDLFVATKKKPGRSHGWAKLHMDGGDGAINIQWHGASRTLICRVVTRGGEPHTISSRFVDFLLARMRRQIAFIHIVPG